MRAPAHAKQKITDTLGDRAEDRFEVRRRWAGKRELHAAIAEHLKSTRRQEAVITEGGRSGASLPPIVSRRRWTEGGAALVCSVALLIAVLLYLLISRRS
jgi:hypothetical protein